VSSTAMSINTFFMYLLFWIALGYLLGKMVQRWGEKRDEQGISR